MLWSRSRKHPLHTSYSQTSPPPVRLLSHRFLLINQLNITEQFSCRPWIIWKHQPVNPQYLTEETQFCCQQKLIQSEVRWEQQKCHFKSVWGDSRSLKSKLTTLDPDLCFKAIVSRSMRKCPNTAVYSESKSSFETQNKFAKIFDSLERILPDVLRG